MITTKISYSRSGLLVLLAIIASLIIVNLPQSSLMADTTNPNGNSRWRGWDYLVTRLDQDGIDQHSLKRIYADEIMPIRTPVPYAIIPIDSANNYRNFFQDRNVTKALKILNKYDRSFRHAEREFDVPRYIVAAIMLVETQFGQVLGKHLVVNRLSRLASIAEPTNVKHNYTRHRQDDSSIDWQAVAERAQYLETQFYPELLSLFHLSETAKIDLRTLNGSSAGAFGIPQFLPTSYIRYGVDGNQDGQISLFDMEDAIPSIANFLRGAGWVKGLTSSEQRQVLWRYNHSAAYTETVQKLAKLFESHHQRRPTTTNHGVYDK